MGSGRATRKRRNQKRKMTDSDFDFDLVHKPLRHHHQHHRHHGPPRRLAHFTDHTHFSHVNSGNACSVFRYTGPERGPRNSVLRIPKPGKMVNEIQSRSQNWYKNHVSGRLIGPEHIYPGVREKVFLILILFLKYYHPHSAVCLCSFGGCGGACAWPRWALFDC